MTSLRDACDTFQHGHLPVPAHVHLRALADHAEALDAALDVYGRGTLIASLEEKVAGILGKPAAVFMPSGTMAQQIALRIWSDRSGRSHIGLHASSHLDRDEQRGYAALHGLCATLLGHPSAPYGSDALRRCAQPLSVAVVELPARRLGGRSPAWDELQALREVADSRGTRLHLDGARLWEVVCGMGRSEGEVAGLFDSVYVSVYKGIGAMAGALLAGPEDFVAEARVWQRRHGGNLPTLHPFVLGASMELDRQRAAMGDYLARAREVAAHITTVPGLCVLPEVPEANMFHVHCQVGAAAMRAARDRVAEEHGVWLFGGANPTVVGAYCEIYSGSGALSADLNRLLAAWSAFGAALVNVAQSTA